MSIDQVSKEEIIYMKQKTKGVVTGIIAVLAVSLLVGGLGALSKGFKDWDVKHWFDTKENIEEKDEDPIKTSIEEEQGVKLKLIRKATSQSGLDVRVFSYTVTPSTATIQDVDCTLKYIDGTDSSAVMKVEVDQSAKEITLTCLQDFDKQIKLEVVSQFDRTKKASINIDYEKKLKEIEAREDVCHFDFGGDEQGRGIDQDDITTNLSDDYLMMFNPIYSKYTIDRNYTYQVDFYEPTSAVTNGHLDVSVVNGNSGMKEVVGDTITQQFLDLIYNKIENHQDFPTPREIWDVSDSPRWKRFLAYSGDNKYLAFDDDNIFYQITNVETGMTQTSADVGQLYIYLPDSNSFRSFYTGITDISIDSGNIVF